MKYEYKAFSENCPEPFEYMTSRDGRKIKELVTVNITIEMEREKYNNRSAKYKLAEKILKIFK